MGKLFKKLVKYIYSLGKKKKKQIRPCRQEEGYSKYAQTREYLKKKGYKLSRTKRDGLIFEYSVEINGCITVKGMDYIELRNEILRILPYTKPEIKSEPFDVDFSYCNK